MTRHLYLRNDCYKPGFGICYYIPDLSLSIEASIRFSVKDLGLFTRFANQRFLSECAHLSKFRIFFDLYPPSLIFCEMPVESIHLMKCDHVDIPFYILHREHVAADIEVHPPVREPGFISYFT